jgi:hypothetical protein
MRHGTERLMASLQNIMGLDAVLAGNEADATAALVFGDVVEARDLIMCVHLPSPLAAPQRACRFFPRAEPQVTWHAPPLSI